MFWPYFYSMMAGDILPVHILQFGCLEIYQVVSEFLIMNAILVFFPWVGSLIFGVANFLPSMYGIFTYIWLFLRVKYGECR